MSTVVQSRGRVLASLTLIKKFLSGVTQDTTCYELEVRLTKLDDLWKEFQEYETQVATMLANNPTANVELKQEEFETKFFETKAKLLELLRKTQPQGNPQPTNNNSFDQLLDQQRIFLENLADRTQAINERSVIQLSENVKLPHVNIQQFSGDYESWPSFYDLYRAAVHNVDTISQVHKFQISRGLLRGPPLNIIRNFLVTESNYTEAWDKLVQRYNKKRPILNSHIDRFIDQPSATSGSPQALRQLSDTSDEIIRGINTLGPEAEARDPWLIRILLNKIDEETRVAWANETLNKEFPTTEEFLEFLNNRCYAKESSVCDNDTKKRGIKGSGSIVKSMYSSPTDETCPCCNRNHYLWKCIKFKRMSIENRRRIVSTSGVCHNCLKPGHEVSACPVDYSCRVCNAKHSTFLHLGSESIRSEQATINSVLRADQITSDIETVSSEISSQRNPSTATDVYNVQTSRLALLPTALVYVKDSAGNNCLARALLDSGSQSTFITETLVQKLHLARSYANVTVSGISESRAEISKGSVPLVIQSRFDQSECIRVEALILTKLTSTIPQTRIEAQWVDDMIKRNLQMADPTYYIPSKIDILLGADIFFELLKADRFNVKNRIIAQSTKFGWVISGVAFEGAITSKSFSVTLQEENISRLIERFWTVEEVPRVSTLSEDEKTCETHFEKTHSRNSDGRYVVRLPFKTNSAPLGYSKSAAINRLMAMERKFKKNSNFQEQYSNFMNEYVSLGHMHDITNETACHEDECFYLPHHAVVKDDSTTTKLRIVFDGSCKSSSGVSLNDKLLVGPTIQKDLVSLLIMFRKHAIAFSSDVEKMYRQIEVHKLDQNYQRILWRNFGENDDFSIKHGHVWNLLCSVSSRTYVTSNR